MIDVYNDILLTSEEFVKSYSNISNNVNGKYLRVAIREAQEIELRGILGSFLLDYVFVCLFQFFLLPFIPPSFSISSSIFCSSYIIKTAGV